MTDRPAQGEQCADSSVLVVVDGHDLDDAHPVAGCAAAQPKLDGVSALETAGFVVSGTTRFGRSLVCRIDDQPADAKCVDTPPQDAYWSYWTAPPGVCTWTYSDLGAAATTPAAGGAEGWSFALDAPAGEAPEPGISPCERTITHVRSRDDDPASSGTGDGSGGRIDPLVGISALAVLLVIIFIVRRRRRGSDA